MIVYPTDLQQTTVIIKERVDMEVRFVSLSFHSSVRCCRFFPSKGLRGLLGPNPVHTMGIGQGTPWMSCQLIAGPLLQLPHKVPFAHQKQLWGSVSCSWILWHVAQFCPGEPGFERVTFWPSDHQSTSSTHWATAALRNGDSSAKRWLTVQLLQKLGD